jgi:hypothetical protein
MCWWTLHKKESRENPGFFYIRTTTVLLETEYQSKGKQIYVSIIQIEPLPPAAQTD